MAMENQHVNRKYIFKRSIFHCYVSLPECRFQPFRISREFFRKLGDSSSSGDGVASLDFFQWWVPVTWPNRIFAAFLRRKEPGHSAAGRIQLGTHFGGTQKNMTTQHHSTPVFCFVFGEPGKKIKVHIMECWVPCFGHVHVFVSHIIFCLWSQFDRSGRLLVILDIWPKSGALKRKKFTSLLLRQWILGGRYECGYIGRIDGRLRL